MSFMTDLPVRAGLARQLLLAGAALLTLTGSALAQVPIKPVKITGAHTVTDSVRLAGSKISGGWREYAADGSWRRVEFVLDREAASVTFGDGEPGRRLPSVTRYAYAGPGGKNAKVGDAKTVYHEARVFAGATPEIRDKANQSSLVPDDVATRVRELGGDIKLMQQAADLKRISELGSALDAARGPAADGGFFGDRPGGPPRRAGGGWSPPGAGVGGDGRASDGTKTPDYDGGPKGPDRGNTGNGEIRHADGTTTTFSSWNDAGSRGNSETHKDASGNITGGGGESAGANGDRTTTAYVRDPRTGERTFFSTTVSPDGLRTETGGTQPNTPSETPYSGRGGFDEAWMDRSLPWFMDAVYAQWKRESDLVKSGGRIAQPGRGEEPSRAPDESPRVGANAVVNCGDSSTNPCARAEGTETDARERLGALTQPPRDISTGGPFGGTGGPLGGAGGPFPVPNPQPKP